MAASYSSFLTTQYYSPIFNTALFDGPFRFYFSQSYESIALKIYHLMQSQDHELWLKFKTWSEKTKMHVFVLIYPNNEDLDMAFQEVQPSVQKNSGRVILHHWDEGLLLGLSQIHSDDEFMSIYNSLIEILNNNLNSLQNKESDEVF